MRVQKASTNFYCCHLENTQFRFSSEKYHVNQLTKASKAAKRPILFFSLVIFRSHSHWKSPQKLNKNFERWNEKVKSSRIFSIVLVLFYFNKWVIGGSRGLSVELIWCWVIKSIWNLQEACILCWLKKFSFFFYFRLNFNFFVIFWLLFTSIFEFLKNSVNKVVKIVKKS